MMKSISLGFILSLTLGSAAFAVETNKISYTPDGYIVSISKAPTAETAKKEASVPKTDIVNTAPTANSNKTI